MKKQVAPQGRTHRILPVMVSLLPAMAFFLLARLVFGWSLFDYVPFSYNDEVGYWHYISTFSEVGFEGGYYGPDEMVPAVEAVHFDAHGPVFPMFYGAIAAVIGWKFHTAVFFNMALLALALWVFTRNLDRSRLMLTLVTILTFWPVLMYMGSVFQESLHHALAVLLALGFSRLLAGERSPRKALFLGGAVLLVGLLRYSWTILLLPLAFCLSESWSWRRRCAAISAACILAVIDVWLFGLLTPPGSDKVFRQLEAAGQGESMVIVSPLAKLLDNFVEYAFFLFRADYPMGTLLALQVVLFAALLTGYWVFRRKRFSESGVPAQAVFHFVNLVPVTVAVMLLDSTFDRVVGPHLLLSLLVAVRRQPRWIVGVIVAVNLLAAPVFLREHRSWWEHNYTYDKTQLLSNQEELARLIEYESDAENPWCNTILISLGDYDERVLAIPAGIGVSYVGAGTGPIELPLRSKYLLGERLVARFGSEDTQLLSDSSIGKIYLNLESACPKNAQ